MTNCKNKIVSDDGDELACGAPAAGEYEMYLDGKVAVRDHLCEDCRKWLETKFDRIEEI